METITDRLQAARADLIAYAAGETGTLRVGVYQSVGTRILPAIIGRFAQEWPRVEVRLTEAASDEGLLELVEPGQRSPSSPSSGSSACAPAAAPAGSRSSIRVIPTDLEPRRIALMWHRDRYRSPAAHSFVNIALEVCAVLAAGLDARRPNPV